MPGETIIPTGKAVLYARVSSEEQQRGYSLDAQVKRAKDYAGRHHLEIVEIVSVVESAKEGGREKFTALMTYIQKHPEIQHVLVEKVDRLLRNYDDAALVVRIVKTHAKFFHFVTDGFVFHAGSSGSEFARFGIGNFLSTWFTWDQIEKIKKGMEEMASQGRWPHNAPFGYKSNPLTKIVEPHPEEAPWLVRIKELAATGTNSLNDIRIKLRQEGCPIRLYPSRISDYIRNPFSTGKFFWAKKFRQGVHPPLISWELHEAAIRGLERLNKPKNRHRGFPYSGLVVCGLCKRSIVFEIAKEKYVYARCAGRTQCGNARLRQEVLQKGLDEAISGLNIDAEVLAWVSAKLREKDALGTAARAGQLQSLQREISKIETLMDKSYDDKLAGVLPDDIWVKKSKQWQDQKIQMIRAREALESANAASSNDLATRLIELGKSMKNIYLSATPHERKHILEFVCSNFVLTQKNLTFTYKKPFELLSNSATCPDRGTLTDDIRTWLFSPEAPSFAAELEGFILKIQQHLNPAVLLRLEAAKTS